MNNVIDWVLAHSEAIISFVAPIAYEYVARIPKTQKDWSLLNLIKRFFDAAIPNNAVNGEKH